MIIINIFWICVAVVITGSFVHYRLAKPRRFITIGFIAFLVFGFQMATMLHTYQYIHAALSQDVDAPTVLSLQQYFINPSRLLTNLLQLDTTIGHLPPSAISDGSTNIDLLPIMLWEVMLSDLILGSVFWLLVAVGFDKVARRRKVAPFVERLRKRLIDRRQSIARASRP
jgi:hypothetical protein